LCGKRTRLSGTIPGKNFRYSFARGDWQADNTFLFINSTGYHGDCRIQSSDYGFLSYDSFVSCGSVVCYSDDELKAANPKFVGRLSARDIRSIYDAVVASERMETRHVKRVCNALKAVL
jgi:hypothetical protein